MGLKGLRNQSDEPADLESEREALRRQRAEAAAELERLKRALAERVAQVQVRERDLADALARIEKREQKLASAEEKHTRLAAARLRLAEAKEAARTVKLPPVDASVESTQAAAAAEESARLAEQAQELDGRESALAEREAELAARRTELDAREQTVAEREASVESTQSPDPEPAPEPEPEPVAASAEELERIEAKLAELREAERAFARTQAELATRSDALAVREELVAAREQAVAAAESPTGTDLAELEARIRRLEQERGQAVEAPTFSGGLRALQERGLRGSSIPDEPLH